MKINNSFYAINDKESTDALFKDIAQNGRINPWSYYAEKYNIRNGQNAISGESARMLINNRLRSKKSKEYVSLFTNKKHNIKFIKEWETFYGNKRYTVKYDFNEDRQKQLEKLIDGLKKDIRKYVRPVIKFKRNEKKGDCCAIINLFDAHVDLLTHKSETGKDSNLDENIKIFENTFDELLSICKEKKPEYIIIPVGSDFFNTNDNQNTTKKGTPQDVMVKSEEAFIVGVKTYRRCIDKASHVAKVYAPIIAGNHDQDKDFYLGQVLKYIYENNENITIDDSRLGRKYFKYGKNLFGFAHGDREWNKIDRLPTIMAEERKKDWAATDYREWFCGDKHHKVELKFLRVKDMVGVTVRFLRSVGGVSQWSVDGGYIGVPKSAELFMYDKDGGMSANYIKVIR